MGAFEVKRGAAALSYAPSLAATGAVTTFASAALVAAGSASAAGFRTVSGSSGKGAT